MGMRSAPRPGRYLPRERPGTPCTGGWVGSRAGPHRDSIPDRPARSQSVYRLSYPGGMLGLFCIIDKY